MSTRALLLAKLASLFADNTTGLITPTKARDVIGDLMNSSLIPDTDGTPGSPAQTDSVIKAGTSTTQSAVSAAQLKLAAGAWGAVRPKNIMVATILDANVTTQNGGSGNAVSINTGAPPGFAGSIKVAHTGSTTAGTTVLKVLWRDAGSNQVALTTANLGTTLRFTGQFRIDAMTSGAAKCHLALGQWSFNPFGNGFGLALSVSGIYAYHLVSGSVTSGANHATTPSVGTIYEYDMVFDVASRTITSYTIDGVSGSAPTTGQCAVGDSVLPLLVLERVTAADNAAGVSIFNPTVILSQ